MIENKQQRPKLIASFSGISAPAPHLTHRSLLITHHCLSPFLFDTNKPHKIIIPLRALLKTKEKQFSIRYKFALGSIGLPAEEGNLACPERTRRACALNRAKARFTLRAGSAGSKGGAPPACALRFWIVALRPHSNQIKCAQPRLPAAAMPTTPAASPAQALESGTFYGSLHPTPRTATINAQPSSLAAVALGKAEPAAPKGKIS